MAFGDQDLPVFFADMGEPAVINGQNVSVLVDDSEMPWEAGSFGSMGDSVLKLTAPITAFTSVPVAGVSVTIRGANYTVSRRTLPGDGRIVELELKSDE